MKDASLKLSAISEAFQTGLLAAGEQLEEIARFQDTFTFAPAVIQVLPLEPRSAYEGAGRSDVWLLEIMDHEQCVGYADLSFPAGSAHGLVRVILNQTELTEADPSDVLQEVTNILINACLAPLASVLNMRLAGGLPSSDRSVMACLHSHASDSGAKVLRLHASFKAGKNPVHGDLSLMIRMPSLMGTWYIMEDRDLRRN